MQASRSSAAPLVVIVEDDTALAAALRFSLELEGYDVELCSSGEALLTLELPAKGACLVVDQRLTEDMTGFHIPGFTTLDFTLRIGLPMETDLTLSVLNLLDEEPGFARLDYNYDPFTANPLGRNFKIGLRKQF